MSSFLKFIPVAATKQSNSALSRKYSSAAMVVAKKFIYANRFVGEPKLNDFNLEEETLPAIKDGGNIGCLFGCDFEFT